jgi:UDP-N-acetylglucosamine 2-epimerase (non-hydrolysing)
VSTLLRPLLIFGTRPEVIKMAPVVRECYNRPASIAPRVCAAGQHRELLRPVMEYFGLRADLDLDVMTPNQTLAGLTARLVQRLDEAIAGVAPDQVVVAGDTTTVMAAALAAFYRRVPLVHVEAGLRTGDTRAPWPEEVNRRITSLVAAVHCAPTRRAAERLRSEGVDPQRIHVTGNPVVDALRATLQRERARAPAWRERYAMLGARRTVLITAHRRENFGAPLENICSAILRLAQQFADCEFVYPVHLNPQVEGPVRRALGGVRNIHLREPVAYPEFVWLMDRAAVILTDSGGVQEEAPSLGKPVLVLRDTTERPEAVEAGAARLVGTAVEAIVAETARLLSDPAEYAARQVTCNPFGDGCAAGRIVDLMEERGRGRD